MVGALAIGLFGAFAILLIHLPPGPIAILSLLALLALGLRPAWWRRIPNTTPTVGGVADGTVGTDDRPHLALGGDAAGTGLTSAAGWSRRANRQAGLIVPVPSSCWGALGWHSLRLGPHLPWQRRKRNGCLLLSSPSRWSRGSRSLAWISARRLRSRHTSR